MRDKILEILSNKHKKSGGHNGTYIPQICLNLGVEYKDIKNDLNSLYKDGKITIREGAHGNLIFLKI